MVLDPRGAKVVIIDKDSSRARFVSVQLGAATESLIQVIDIDREVKLEAGQLVVVRGNERLRPNQLIKIVGE